MEPKRRAIYYASMNDIDTIILGLLQPYKNVIPFSVFLEKFLLQNGLFLERGVKKEQLASDETTLYSILNVYFYFGRLRRLGYLEFLKMPSENEFERSGVRALEGMQPYYIPQEISKYILELYNCNLVFSFDYTFYVGNGHISEELAEARKQTRMAETQVECASKTLRWSIAAVVIAIISSVISICSVLCCS